MLYFPNLIVQLTTLLMKSRNYYYINRRPQMRLSVLMNRFHRVISKNSFIQMIILYVQNMNGTIHL